MKNRSRSEGQRSGATFPHKQPAGIGHLAPRLSEEVTTSFNQALGLHQAGRLMEAEALYRKVLQAQPRHFDGLHLLGVVNYQCGRHDDAVRQIDLALKVNPKVAAAHNNRGAALKELKRYAEALRDYDQAIALRLDYVDAFNNRGSALKALKRFEDAVASYDQ